MSKIQVLTDTLINKIAAGEIVERPASVVKELVENAIDAGASSIIVELEQGGKQCIRITDNGCGMDAEDLHLATQRHTTSKIIALEDLYHLKTLGFRGEALSSIAAVSHVEILTRCKQQEAYLWKENKIESATWGYLQGTQVSVRNLFFNVPARARSLRSSASEWAVCLEWMQALALSQPRLALELVHNGKQVLKLAGNAITTGLTADNYHSILEKIRKRAVSIFATGSVAQLHPFFLTTEYIQVSGLASPPGVDRASARHIYSIINGRWLRDRALKAAILRGYHSHLLVGRFPVVVLYGVCDPSLVDANVHPAKAELRFEYAKEVYAAITQALRSMLRAGAWAQHKANWVAGDAALANTSVTLTSSENNLLTSEDSTSLPSYPAPIPDQPTPSSLNPSKAMPVSMLSRPSAKASSLPSLPSSTQKHPNWQDLKYIGQIFRGYLIFEDTEAMLLVDQHALHERILYETLQKTSMSSQRQTLLFVEQVVLSPIECASILEYKDILDQVGFTLQIQPPHLLIHSVPTGLQHTDWQRFFSMLCTAQTQIATIQTELLHPVLASIACHRAIRVGDRLEAHEVAKLLEEAQHIDFYLNCPHGRPVFSWHTHAQLEAWFAR